MCARTLVNAVGATITPITPITAITATAERRTVRDAGRMPTSTPRPPDRVSEPPTGAALGALLGALEALVGRARRLQRAAAGDRVVLGITGSPGAGKTTLAQALVSSLNAERDDHSLSAGEAAAAVAVHLPMDGFHLSNATLDRLGLRERKGAIETFDGWGFLALLERVHRELDHPVYAPAFERAVDEPVAGEIAIEPATRIVVVEGNYLLSDAEPWRRIRPLLHEAWFCDTDHDERMSRLVHRHSEHGRSAEAALAWATEVDGANARAIGPSRGLADLVVSGVTWAIVDDDRG